MRPGERITLIRRIASTLAEENWPDIALTLGQFGVGYDDDFRGGNYEFVIDAIQGVDDAVLLDLHAYLHPEDQAGTRHADASGAPWDGDAFRLFVSHTSAHREFAGELRQRLQQVGIDAFVAHDVIEPTSEWRDVIESALNTCDALVAMLTTDFVASRWCDQEVGFCMARGVLIVPLRLEADPHGFIGKYQGLTVSAGQRASAVAPALFDLLANHAMTRRRMARPIVYRYARSRSFDNTRAAFELLKTIPAELWTDQMVQDVLAAAETNSQVEQAVVLDGVGTPMPDAARSHLNALGVLPPPPPADDDIPF
jgi:hypothetical protein